LKPPEGTFKAKIIESRPARGAWIETWRGRDGSRLSFVAPRAGRVD